MKECDIWFTALIINKGKSFANGKKFNRFSFDKELKKKKQRIISPEILIQYSGLTFLEVEESSIMSLASISYTCFNIGIKNNNRVSN